MTNCSFKIKYFDLEKREYVECECGEKCDEGTSQCLFHDEQYLQHQNCHEEIEKKKKQRLTEKINESIFDKKPLRCIGYHLPNGVRITGNFPKTVDFSKSTFQEVNFSKALFSDEVILVGTKFHGEAYFSETKFFGGANFSGAIFSHYTSFFGAMFSGGAYFNGTNFSEVNFHGSRFYSEAHFPKAIFSKETEFIEARFSKEAYFYEVKFYAKVDFTAARFSHEAYFSGEFNDKAKINYVIFEKGEQILFDVEDLSKVSFLNTDITRVKFGEKVQWSKEDNKYVMIDEKELENFFERSIYWFSWDDVPGKDEHKFITHLKELLNLNLNGNGDLEIIKSSYNTICISSGNDLVSIKLNKDLTKATLSYNDSALQFFVKRYKNMQYVSTFPVISLASVKALYRNLRENTEYRMRYDEASEFFIREMELKRKYRECRSGDDLTVVTNGLIRRNLSLTGLYYNLFKYGEDLKRPALILLLPLFIVSTSYWIAIDSPLSFSYGGLINILNATERTMLNILQVERKDPQLVDNMIRAISLGILGMLLIPLRRRFERKFRH
ncbi:MAG TPA: pentapeptide repeat-containing protein [Nitrososphaeraceae archaeon]